MIQNVYTYNYRDKLVGSNMLKPFLGLQKQLT